VVSIGDATTRSCLQALGMSLRRFGALNFICSDKTIQRLFNADQTSVSSATNSLFATNNPSFASVPFGGTEAPCYVCVSHRETRPCVSCTRSVCSSCVTECSLCHQLTCSLCTRISYSERFEQQLCMDCHSASKQAAAVAAVPRVIGNNMN
jgi:hypothetical protein